MLCGTPMKKPRILVFFGTRPEALKLAPVIRALKADSSIDSKNILTAQHREMIDQVLKLFKIRSDVDLDLMTKNQTLASLSQKLLGRLSDVFRKLKPDLVMVQGDTTTAFMVSLAAFYEKIPVAHIEAGLRSWNKYHPFPEEINRRLISHLADYHFAPTPRAKQNLMEEGIPPRQITVTGNTIIDSLLWMTKNLKSSYPRLRGIDFSKKIILLTAHRRENIGAPLVEITQAVKKLLKKFRDIEVVYPVHLNPGVQKIIRKNFSGIERIHLLPPLSYDETVYLMNKSYLIMTDSGGIQEEAPSLGKPVLVLREVSERPEGIKAGALKIVGTDSKSIVSAAGKLLTSKTSYQKMARVRHVYGDGKAASRIVKQLKVWLKK